MWEERLPHALSPASAHQGIQGCALVWAILYPSIAGSVSLDGSDGVHGELWQGRNGQGIFPTVLSMEWLPLAWLSRTPDAAHSFSVSRDLTH